jgi:rhodanese-related sulfurtransferase
MQHITISSFKEVLSAEKNNPTVDFINVCTPVEYREKHIEGVRNVPLDSLSSHLEEFRSKKTIYVHCRSGKRSSAAIEKLISLGVRADLINVQGGILAWDEANNETISLSTRMPIMRQVFVGAGAFVFAGVLLTHFLHPAFLLLPLFVSLGLLVSGFTGWCAMALVLAKMPWNK